MADLNGNGIADDLEPILAAREAAGFLPIALPGATTTGAGSSINKQYRQYTEQQVEGIAEPTFQKAIGRAANADELKNVQEQLNVAEKANPTVSKSGPTSVTSGGIDAEQLVKKTAEMSPEYENYQKATTYFDAMLGSLRGPVGGGM